MKLVLPGGLNSSQTTIKFKQWPQDILYGRQFGSSKDILKAKAIFKTKWKNQLQPWEVFKAIEAKFLKIKNANSVRDIEETISRDKIFFEENGRFFLQYPDGTKFELIIKPEQDKKQKTYSDTLREKKWKQHLTK
jgi:hypothetical protein